MENLIFKLIFVALAAVFKSIADTIAFHDGGKYFKGKFFSMTRPAIYIPYTKYPITGWHLANSGSIVFFCLAAFGDNWKLVIAGAVFILVFNLFFNKIL